MGVSVASDFSETSTSPVEASERCHPNTRSNEVILGRSWSQSGLRDCFLISFYFVKVPLTIPISIII